MGQWENPRFAICKLFKCLLRFQEPVAELKKCVVSDAFVKNIYRYLFFELIERYSREDTNIKNCVTLNETRFSMSEYNITQSVGD